MDEQVSMLDACMHAKHLYARISWIQLIIESECLMIKQCTTLSGFKASGTNYFEGEDMLRDLVLPTCW